MAFLIATLLLATGMIFSVSASAVTYTEEYDLAAGSVTISSTGTYRIYQTGYETNATENCEWEFISVPSKDIPFFGYSYFSTETLEEKYQRQIIEKEGFLDPTGRFDHAFLTRYDN